ncbi:MalT transcriptional regulator family protein [Cohnella rhizosphaerae]|uniref:MalT-like winged helix domain-containing protein n=1 Tax=Cohnella rhizosphaerae TaxID=1457232 RepID=A0A9X4KZM8_9BACL|nr:hypothetical protein [Cohnella rhizosphaerae]MDG0814234.1 hypothetical protein [Cohnella rhizosphaerae]
MRPGDLLTRQPLLDGLNQGLHCKLTTVIAPSGYGKTTCLSQWAAQCPYPVAWLSLDRLDNDQERFWSHLVTALRQAFPSSGEATTAYLAASEAHRTERLELALLRDLQAVGQPFVLLLDDLQVIDLAPIFDTIAYLLDYLPDHAHLYAASRGTLPLKLARLRAKGQLCRLEVGDLRLRPQEGVRYLSDRLNVPLGEDELALLVERTEGWFGGLHLAVQSLRQSGDPARFMQSFGGRQRDIAGYLMEEFLAEQPSEARQFLLQTSMLAKMNGDLCRAVSGLADSELLLEQLYRSNMLIAPLDFEHGWFRYHQLFGEFLQQQAARPGSGQVARRARRRRALVCRARAIRGSGRAFSGRRALRGKPPDCWSGTSRSGDADEIC